MTIAQIVQNSLVQISPKSLPGAAALAFLLMLTACHSKDSEQASHMTTFSSKPSKSATPHPFTLPADQMAPVQVVTVQPTTLTHSLRLTGAVAYNAFNTPPVITQ